ncbi:HET-domain-containing protein [Zopfia rhizophila CBS 207.26]|uniref:HET-domain-containing protein n=1 Tax=Zopfia rhizophila CBS 207.26 TaxID=1314779 RepID=A0A6A6E814_9PEZI|nr:HET-domain-containing protein [Zopfia rhizophila CBS 207.26]
MNLHETPRESPISPSEIPVQPSRPKPESKTSSFSLPWGKHRGANKDSEQETPSERSLPYGTTAQSSSKGGEPQFKLKIPKSLRGVANLSELEIDLTGGDISIVSDTKKKERKEGLCTACSKIDFEQFDSRNTVVRESEGSKFTHKLVFLDRILRKKRKGSCNFCNLIFDAIAENDPFRHPAVKDHLPRELAGMTFRQWAEGLNWTQHVPIYKAAYPFGRSRDNVDLQQEVQGQDVVVKGNTNNDQLTSDDAAKGASVAAVAALNAGIWTETDTERVKIMATVGTIIPTVTSLMTNLDAKLPVAVSIIIHNVNHADAGLLNVDVWGYGNAHRAPLSRISTFNLRIASGYQPSLDGSLKYGKLLQPEVDVEGDCKRWLVNCFEHHGQLCDEPSWRNELQPPSGPHFRLIDVNGMRVVQKDMVNLSQHNKPRYAALSYVWGAAGKQCLNLHVRNLEDLSSQLEGQALPMAKTIRDAIEVTRRMELQYLWVDSLCIIQHDDRGEDNPDARASQIEQMDRIFGHAAITIVAADGLDAEAGLPGISSRAIRNQIAREVQPNVNVLLAVQYNNTYGKWDTRAWTLQEKLLSKRMLIFNGGYRAWDGASVLLRSPFFSEYANLLAQYTSRDMTDSKDALNAILGLLKALEKMTNSDRPLDHPSGPDAEQETPTGYTLHGLPEKFLDLALLWQPPAAKGVHLTKRAHDDLPSWSWTGWEVGKDPDFHSDAAKMYHAKPGVRFEEPFWVSTNDDLSLRKVVARANDDKGPAEERFKPLVMWYKCLRSPVTQVMQRVSQNRPTDATGAEAPVALVPVNRHGLGLALGPADAEELRKFREDAIRLRTKADPPIDPGPPSIPADVPIDNRHLVCETQVARFRLRPTAPRQETLWTRSDKGLIINTELMIPEAEVVDASDKVVGRVIPTDQRKGLSSGLYDFILLSESQYWGNEERVDVSGLPLFNVMFVEWDNRREFAARVGLGKIQKRAWWAAKPTQEVVILK